MTSPYKRQKKKKRKTKAPQEVPTEPVSRRCFLKAGGGLVVAGVVEHMFAPLRWAARRIWKPEVRFIFWRHKAEDYMKIKPILDKNLKWATHIFLELVVDPSPRTKKRYAQEKEAFQALADAVSAGSKTFYDPTISDPRKAYVNVDRKLSALMPREPTTSLILRQLKGTNLNILMEDAPFEAIRGDEENRVARTRVTKFFFKTGPGGGPPVTGMVKYLRDVAGFFDKGSKLALLRDSALVDLIKWVARWYHKPRFRGLVVRGSIHHHMHYKLMDEGFSVQTIFEEPDVHLYDRLIDKRLCGEHVKQYTAEEEQEFIIRYAITQLYQQRVLSPYKAPLPEEKAREVVAEKKLTGLVALDELKKIFPDKKFD